MGNRLQIFDEILKAFPADAGDFGFCVAVYKLRCAGRDKKVPGYVKAVSSYTEKTLRPLLDRYVQPGFESILYAKRQLSKTPVWFCWLSASDNMPDSVNLCYQRLRRMTPDSAEIHRITLKNISDYIDLPLLIEERYRSRKLNFRGLRDYIRAAVLSAYGGLWIDPEVYVLHELSDSVLNAEFYSIKAAQEDPCAASLGYWNSSVLSVKKNHPAVCFLRDAHLLWWEVHDRQIDDAQFDYFLYAAFQGLPDVRLLLENVQPNNPDFLSFRSFLNLPFDANVFREIAEKNDFLLLSSDDVLMQKNNTHKPTFFGTLYLKETYGL